ncbi:MAG TPA: FHA domain-containing protein [Planctomycetota bacterium]|nr:FHA domain-containing protein [Planctomycetota bacterium]
MQTRQLIGFLLGTGARPLAIYVGDVLTVGRDSQNMINVPDVLVSRQHALIDCTTMGKVCVMDLGSSNGTYLNGTRLLAHDKVVLSNNDTIRIGGKLFSFVTNQPNAEPRAFGARVATQETVKDGLIYKNGKFIEVSPQPAAQPLPQALLPRDTQPDVTTTQRVAPIGAQSNVQSNEASNMVEATLAGSLADQNLAQILQYLHTNQKSGELLVKGKRNQGRMLFDQGQITYAECGDRKGPPAIYVCAREHAGSFRFTMSTGAPAAARNVNDPMMQIIFECCKRIDEAELAGN